MLEPRSLRAACASISVSVAVAFCAACGAESDPDTGLDGGISGQVTANDGIGAGAPDGSSGNLGAGGDASAIADAATGHAVDAGVRGDAGGRDAGSALGTTDGSAGDAGGGDAGGAVGTADGSASAGDAGVAAAACDVSPITDDMRDSYANMNNAYYEKYASANGVIVATGSQVDDEAILRYCRLLTEMFSNEKIRQAVLAENMWFTMISENEQLSSLPQIAKAYGTSLNARARGLGGLTPTICAEDSIMCMPGDPWVGDCICPHETGHTLYSSGIAKVPDLSSRLTSITNSVRSSGRLANAYVWMDGDESGMMAWGVQAWYDCAINGTEGSYHSDINTRAELQKELPDFYQFLSELLPTDNKYDDCYSSP